jgi:hypothetical protein
MTRDYRQSNSLHADLRRPTNTTNPRLFTDNHTLQYLCTLKMPQILCDIPNPPIFERIFPKYRIEDREGMTYLVD